MFVQVFNTEWEVYAPMHTVDIGDLSGVVSGVTNLSVTDITPTTITVASDTGDDAVLPTATNSSAGVMSSAQATKLSNINQDATQNQTDVYLLDRANHTGTQTSSSISDFTTASRTAVIDSSINSGVINKSPNSDAVFNALFTKVDKVAGKGLSSEDYTTTEKTKLSNIANNASANSSDTVLLNRSNHTGSQPSSTISDFTSSVNTLISSGITGKENTIAAGTTGQYWRGDKTWQTFPTIPAAQVNSDWNASSGIAQILNKPTLPAFTQSSASRSLNSAFQISSTKGAFVSYSVQLTVTASIAGGQNGDVVLEIASDSGFTSNVQTVAITGLGQTYTLAVALQGVQPQTSCVAGFVPAGYYARLRSVNNTGTPTYSVRAQQEVLL